MKKKNKNKSRHTFSYWNETHFRILSKLRPASRSISQSKSTLHERRGGEDKQGSELQIITFIQSLQENIICCE